MSIHLSSYNQSSLLCLIIVFFPHHESSLLGQHPHQCGKAPNPSQSNKNNKNNDNDNNNSAEYLAVQFL